MTAAMNLNATTSTNVNWETKSIHVLLLQLTQAAMVYIDQPSVHYCVQTETISMIASSHKCVKDIIFVS